MIKDFIKGMQPIDTTDGEVEGKQHLGEWRQDDLHSTHERQIKTRRTLSAFHYTHEPLSYSGLPCFFYPPGVRE